MASSSMTSESNDLFFVIFGCYGMEHDVCMCNISMKRKISRLHGGIKNDKIA